MSDNVSPGDEFILRTPGFCWCWNCGQAAVTADIESILATECECPVCGDKTGALLQADADLPDGVYENEPAHEYIFPDGYGQAPELVLHESSLRTVVLERSVTSLAAQLATEREARREFTHPDSPDPVETRNLIRLVREYVDVGKCNCGAGVECWWCIFRYNLGMLDASRGPRGVETQPEDG